MTWNDVLVFISSTFNDMHAERDYLVKEVFPELAEWCERRDLRLSDIDLRWGVTAGDAKARETVRACLKGVDQCRPFFLCLLGQRRGWVPNDPDFLKKYPNDGEISPATFEEYPGLSSLSGARSVTEMEIEHALLSPMLHIVDGQAMNSPPDECALFFFRRDGFTQQLTPAQRRIYTNEKVADYGSVSAADEALSDLKKKILDRFAVVEYACTWDGQVQSPELLAADGSDPEGCARGRLTRFTVPADALAPALLERLRRTLETEFPALPVPEGDWPLKDVMLAQFALTIQSRFPGAQDGLENLDRYARDARQQAVFRHDCADGALKRPDALAALEAWRTGDGKTPFVLSAPAGLGKSTILANWINLLQDGGQRVFARFCGASDLAGDAYALWDSLLHEAGLPTPPTLQDLQKELPALLGRFPAPCFLVLDGVDQLAGGPDMLTWLPQELPDGLRLALSLRDDGETNAAERFLRKGATVFELPPLSDNRALINAYLLRYLKALDERCIGALCALPGNPLFLTVLMHDLRTYGSYQQLEAEIARHGRTPKEAFAAVLSRMEGDLLFDVLPPSTAVPLLFGLLASARNGLTEEELKRCFQMRFPKSGNPEILGTIRVFLRQVRPFLVRWSGRYGFRYETFREAALERYGASRQDAHLRLAECFQSFCDPRGDGSFPENDERALAEYAYHLCQGRFEKGIQLYSDPCYLTACCSAGSPRTLLMEYDALKERCPGPWRSLIFRHLEALERWPNLLPSLLYASGNPQLREAVRSAQDSGILRRPWLKVDERLRIPPRSAAGLICEKRSEMTLTATAVALASKADLAFYTVGRGQIRAADTVSLQPFGAVLSTRQGEILGLNASADGQTLVVSFEDGIAEAFRLRYEGGSLSAKSVGTLRYLVPMYEAGCFVVEEGAIWCQVEEGVLQRLCVAEEGLASSERLILEHAGEVSSLAAHSGRLWLTVRAGRRTMLGVIGPGGRQIWRDLAQDDAAVLGAAQNGCFLASRVQDDAGYPLTIVDSTLAPAASVSLPGTAAALCVRDGQALILSYAQAEKAMWLWDLDSGEKQSARHDFPYQERVFVRPNSDGSLAMISNLSLSVFTVETGGAQAGTLLLDAAQGADGPVAVGRESDGSYALYRSEGRLELCRTQDPLCCALGRERGLLLAPLRQAYEFDLKGTIPARPLALAAEAVQWTSWGRLRGPRETFCALDARGCLRDMDGRLLVNLSSLQLKGAALHAGADVLVITGVSQCPRAIARQEPYVAVFLRAEAGAGLLRLGERFFPMARGPIRALCRDAFSGRYFLFFDLPAGVSLTPWTTALAGTAEEFLGGREMERELPCPAGPLSAAVSENVLLVCGGGVVVACRAGDLTYLSAYAGAVTRVLPAEVGALLLEEAALAALTPINGEEDLWNRTM